MTTLHQLLQSAYPDGGIALSKNPTIGGLQCDSRQVRPGDLFIAVRGVKKNGAEFIEEALARGAAAVVTEEPGPSTETIARVVIPDSRQAVARLASAFYDQPSKKMKVLGITGTNGKTTTSYILEYLLSRQKRKTGVIGTVNYRFQGQEIPATETTPGPIPLNALLSRMAQAGCDTVVMEVSSHALDQDRTLGIDFEGALFTNLTQDHLDYHKTMEAYFEAKSKLFTALPPGKFSVINVDDPWARRLLAQGASRPIQFGIHEPADFRAEHCGMTLEGTHFELRKGSQILPVKMSLMGIHNVYNALGALAAAEALGLALPAAVEHLADFTGVPGRLERVYCGQDFAVFVDFAHTPDGLDNVLKAVAPYKQRKLLLVFGCGGDRDRLKRSPMGLIAAKAADFVFVTSDNPRQEDPAAIAQEVVAGFPPDFKNYAVVLDRARAIRQALLLARQGDIVLLAGKGHERTQVMGQTAMPFSDRSVAEKILHGH